MNQNRALCSTIMTYVNSFDRSLLKKYILQHLNIELSTIFSPGSNWVSKYTFFRKIRQIFALKQTNILLFSQIKYTLHKGEPQLHAYHSVRNTPNHSRPVWHEGLIGEFTECPVHWGRLTPGFSLESFKFWEFLKLNWQLVIISISDVFVIALLWSAD